MGQFSIIQPQATVNLVSNPSPKTATTGYTAVSSASLALVTTKQRRAGYSLQVTPSSNTGSGVYYTLPSNTTSGQDYTMSVDVWLPAGLSYTMYVANTSGTIVGTATTVTGDDRWHRYQVTYTENSSTTRRLYITKNAHASVAPFYVTGLQFENLPYATTYCDGDQKGCIWLGANDAATSQRSSQERSGGKLINLESMGAYLVSQQGTGMPDINNLFTPYAGIDGAFYQKRSIKQRVFTIAMSVAGSDTDDWHIKRQALIDLIKPDLVYPTQPFMLVYDGGGEQVFISCYYDGGFEMTDGKRDIETIAVRCLAVDPFWKFDGVSGAGLTVSTSVSNANGIVVRSTSGVWSALGSGVSGGSVFTIAQGLDGIYYVGGSFTSAGGVANTRAIAQYNPFTATWSAMGSGGNTVGDEVYDIQVAPNGELWVAGHFTDMGGVAAADYVAKWRTSLGTWAAPAGGPAPTIGALGLPIRACLSVDGSQYFLPTGGSSMQRYDTAGLSWSSIGVSAGSGVFACIRAPDGNIIVSHNGATISAVSTPSRVAQWNIATSTWTAFGATNPGGTIREFAYDASNRLYGASAGSTSNLVVYNGTDWEFAGLFGTTSTSGYTVGPSLDGSSVFIGGSFITAKTVTLYDRFAEWNGTAVNPPDIDLPGTATVYKIKVLRDGTLAVGYDTTGTATAAGITSITNVGSAVSYPKFIITGTSGSVRIYQIANKTTGKVIYLSTTINAGETITLDLTPGAIKFTSTFRGNIMTDVLPGSALSDWQLLPGINSISFLSGSSSVAAVMTWPSRCWSIDSSGI